MSDTPSSLQTQYRVTLIGCGKMGSAMLRSWLNDDLIEHVNVIDPSPVKIDGTANDTRVSYCQSLTSTSLESDIVVLAVKPQILEGSLKSIEVSASASLPVFLSIAAGQTIHTLRRFLGSNTAIIRTMPNTPAAIGKGMSVSVSNTLVSDQQKLMANKLLQSTGQSLWIEDEALMDAVTALSGSGPAYIFYLIEVMANAGEKLGLDKDMAMSLARQTVIGSAALAETEQQLSASTLRENVTSPGGTTQAALEKLMDGEFQNIFDGALQHAKKRAEELNG